MTPAEQIVHAALREALAVMDLEARVAAALPDRVRSVNAIAVGKAAPAMMAGALRRWPIAHALVITTDGTALRRDPRVTVLRAGHPLPDARSVHAAELCLELAAEGPLLFLVSGGTSALLCAPAPGITLRDKQRVTRALLRGGASIHEINVVRKHLSRIKGGGLRAVRTLVASDVLGGAIEDVGSGPSVASTSRVGTARRILARYLPGTELPLCPRKKATRSPTRIVASPEEHARVLARLLRARLLPPSNAPVAELAEEYTKHASRLAPGGALVRAAEPSLEVGVRGRGGRSTHLAALVALSLPPGVTFCASASDGVDGSSGTAGAIVDARLRERWGVEAITRALAHFETGPLHLDAGTALPRRPTGHNLADVHVLVRR